jgi:hypothetical protein
MVRQVLNLAALLSLLLCAAVLCLLGLTLIRGEYHVRPHHVGNSSYMFAADRSAIEVFRFSASEPRHLKVRVPYGVAVPTLALLPALTALRWRRKALRRRRILSGHCSTCGYDLRASPGTCPECGESAGTIPA